MQRVSKAVHPVVASAGNALEARSPKNLLDKVGRNMPASACPNGAVKLHELCELCTMFAEPSVCPEVA